MNDQDFDIIRSILEGQVNDYEVLVKKYQSTVFNVLFRMLHQREPAEALTQDVFVKAYENLGSFNFSSRFFSWLYRIAINTAISYRQKNQRFVSLDHMPQHLVKPVEENLMAKERSAALHAAINRLKEKYKTVIVLRYYEQLSYNEMAGILNIEEKKIKSRLFDARQLLRDYLQKCDFF
jgi:RNA polymerase sigma-70 factor (ECF subfamily)